MSNSASAPLVSVPSPERADTSPPPASRPGWLREPLLHFVVLGGLLFAADHALVARSDDLHTIVVGADVDSEAIETFEAARGRKPDAKELEALHHVWLDNEVLYREGLALQVDKGDDAIRERVIFKALSVIDSNVKVPAPTDDVLRKWFESHRENYDEPARYDFDEAALTGQNDEATVRELVKQLNSGMPGDAKAGLRVFKGRPEANLVQSYGPELAEALTKSTPGQWQALRTKDGWRAMVLNAVTPPKPASFENLRGPIQQDWTDATASEQRSTAVAALAKKYTIKYEEQKSHGAE